MKCPFCGHREDWVVDSRVARDGQSVRRRRECAKCHRRYTTYEHIEDVMPTVRKRDGRLEPFDRGKLRASILAACGKDSPAFAVVDDIAKGIETSIRTQGESAIASREIGRLVLEHLRQTDPLSTARYGFGQRGIVRLEDVPAWLRELDDHRQAPKASAARMLPKRASEQRP